MTDFDELSRRVDMMRAKGVAELHDGELHILLGPLPAQKSGGGEAPEALHPADLVAMPPDLGSTEAS